MFGHAYLNHWKSALLLAFCGALFFGVYDDRSRPAGATYQSDNSQTARAWAQAYMHHRESFVFFTCRFKVRAGTADSEQSALEGVLSDVFPAEGSWIVNGRKMRFELISDPAATARVGAAQAGKKGPASRSVIYPLPSHIVLDDGENEINFQKRAGTANLSDETTRGKVVNITPWSNGMMAPGESCSPAKRILQKLDECRVDQTKVLNGIPVVSVSVPISEHTEWHYFLDPKRGFLHRQIWTVDAGTKHVRCKLIVTRLQECSKGRWFPMKSVVLWTDNSSFTPPFSVREISVTELEVDSPPSDSQFVLELPKNTVVNDGRDGYTQVLVKDTKRITTSDLPQANAQARQISAARKDALAREAGGGYADWLLWTLGASVVCLILGVVAWKRWR